jgi:hypothetical protein
MLQVPVSVMQEVGTSLMDLVQKGGVLVLKHHFNNV